MTVQLALRKNDTRITAKAIQRWTNSIYSHCELVVGGVCYSSSAMDGGVRGKKINLDPEKWDVIDLPWVRGEGVVDYFVATDHHFYGWMGLVYSQVLNRNWSGEAHQFCSQWCAAAMGLPNPASYSPATLADIARFVNSMALSSCAR